jgi:hypothetical protein
MQYPTCCHIKLDGTYCGSPFLRDRKYCYHHLMQRGRRLRRARALPLGTNLGSANLGSPDNASRIQEYPEFEKHLGLAPGADIDAEITAVLQKAAEEEEYRRAEAMPEPPPGVRAGSPADRLYREEAYQTLRYQLRAMQHQLRDYNEQKRQQIENMKKEMLSATSAPERLADSA